MESIMKTDTTITPAVTVVQLTPNPKRRTTASAFRDATEAIKTLCEHSSLTNSSAYRQSYEAVMNEYLMLRTLKKRLISLTRSNALSSYGAVPQMIYALGDQIWDAWNWLEENRHELGMDASILKWNGIPMTYEDAHEKHSATIARHRKIIRSNKGGVQSQIPEDHSYDIFFEYVFAMLYGCLPDVGDPILDTNEFDEIVDDFRLVMGFDPCGDF